MTKLSFVALTAAAAAALAGGMTGGATAAPTAGMSPLGLAAYGKTLQAEAAGI